jgi:hypothetical protein
MPSYILRTIDPELWKRVKARAERDGHALRWIILRLLEDYADHGLVNTPEAKANARKLMARFPHRTS